MHLTLVLAIMLAFTTQPQPPAPLADFEIHEAAPDVFVARPVRVRHGFVEPNVTFIVGQDGVMVVDAGFLPSSARILIEKLRTITSKPVTYLVNTHWHGDHHHGNTAWREAYPNVRIIAHAEGRREIEELGKPDLQGFITSYTQGIAAAKQRVASRTDAAGKPMDDAGVAAAVEQLAAHEQTLAELGTFSVVTPSEVYTTARTVDLGGLDVRLLYLGRANTYGDAVVYVPDRRLVVTGDIVVFPRPYLSSDHFAAWTLALERLARLEAATIVPGHGVIQQTPEYLGRLRALMSTMLMMVDEAASEGLTLDAVQQRITSDALAARLEADWGVDRAIVTTNGAALADFVRRAYAQRQTAGGK